MARKLTKSIEEAGDEFLGITTLGRDDSHADENHHPYEPTPYSVLARMVEEGVVDKDSSIVDYGSGRGRVGIYFSKMTGCKSLGIEYDEELYTMSNENLRESGVENAEFLLMNAEDFCPSDENVFFFFNPFSAKILTGVLAKIEESYYDNPRSIRLCFYYPDDEYISLLMRSDLFMFSDEIDMTDFFGGDKRERVLIFECEEYL
ncbi:MAG: SAM-dependent methyltransferase [Eubacteriaceae bacterium]|nr:SAM-dependent methyltransferase [Eubacteriaceae bacterium]